MVPRSIFLVGYRASGKSCVGKALARRLGWRFRDTDDAVKSRLGMSISEFFAERGEDAFRQHESDALGEIVRSVADDQPCVVACGGGIVLRQTNVEMMRAAGTVVWLRAGVGTLSARLAGDDNTAADRPTLTGTSTRSEVESVLAERTPIYRDAAHLELDTELLEPEELAESLAEELERRGFLIEPR